MICKLSLVLVVACSRTEPTSAPGETTTPLTLIAGVMPVAGDHVLREFHFASGEVLPELRIHYMTLGTPKRDAAGHTTNAVLVMHGTTGSGRQFERKQFADVLFGKGQPLDLAQYFVILPDDIGHGASSKPSDGRHAKFPHYGYADMVAAEHALVVDGLHVDHLRLVMGTSMGCMHAWMWAEKWPEVMDAVMALACLPVAIGIMGRNRQWRKMIIDAIEQDPEWRHGEYVAAAARGAAGRGRSAGARGVGADRRSGAHADPRGRGREGRGGGAELRDPARRQRRAHRGRRVGRLRSLGRARGDHGSGDVREQRR